MVVETNIVSGFFIFLVDLIGLVFGILKEIILVWKEFEGVFNVFRFFGQGLRAVMYTGETPNIKQLQITALGPTIIRTQ